MTVRQGWARLWSPLAIGIMTALLSLVLFERLANEMLEGDTQQFDATVRSFLHSFASPWLTEAMRLFTGIGNIDVVMAGTAAGCLALWLKRRRNGTVLLAVNTFGGVLLMGGLKLLFHRQRPEPYFGTALPSGYSFPSGHALVAFCFYGALASIVSTELEHWPGRAAVWAGAAAMTLLIGISRIYLGVHYPSDVIAGYLAALCWVTGVSVVYHRFRGRDLTNELQPSSSA